VTAVAAKVAIPGRSFFPLTVNYQEKTYAAGRIPGGFFKREGRPTEKETLTSRLIDRPIRPLFPDGFNNEVQVVATVISLNPDVQSDIPALLGASAALALSGCPFQGPIGAARVGYKDGKYLLNPTATQVKDSQLDLVVCGTSEAVLMVESEAKGLSEDVMLGAVMFGHAEMQKAIQVINEMVKEAGKPRWDWQAAAKDVELEKAVAGAARARSRRRIRSPRSSSVTARSARSRPRPSRPSPRSRWATSRAGRRIRWAANSSTSRARSCATASSRASGASMGATPGPFVRSPSRLASCPARTGRHSSRAVRHRHSSSRRSARDAMPRSSMRSKASAKKPFMLHYNFPPFSVGETGMMTGPKRREIGHGNLARRGIFAVMPDMAKFPYIIRVVSEILESNGSSSMASVCGTSLALMDAGVRSRRRSRALRWAW